MVAEEHRSAAMAVGQAQQEVPVVRRVPEEAVHAIEAEEGEHLHALKEHPRPKSADAAGDVNRAAGQEPEKARRATFSDQSSLQYTKDLLKHSQKTKAD